MQRNKVNDKLPFGVLVRFRPELVQALFLCKTCATEAPPGQEGSRIIDIIEATAKELAAEVRFSNLCSVCIGVCAKVFPLT